MTPEERNEAIAGWFSPRPTINLDEILKGRYGDSHFWTLQRHSGQSIHNAESYYYRASSFELSEFHAAILRDAMLKAGWTIRIYATGRSGDNGFRVDGLNGSETASHGHGYGQTVPAAIATLFHDHFMQQEKR